MRASIILAVLAVSSGAAAADGDARTPRKFWLGGTFGAAIYNDPEDDSELSTLAAEIAAGLDIGFQRIAGNMAFYLDGDLLFQSSVYRGRGGVVLGYGFDVSYRLPCAAPPGYSCIAIYRNRPVRSIFGLKLGIEALTSPRGETLAVEAGLAFRSQISFDLSALYDPERAAPGMVMDFTWQLGPFYWGMENHMLFSEEEPVAAIVSLVLGYAPRMWQPREL